MEKFKRNWIRIPKPVRQPLVFLFGWLVVVTGIILLPLPGPGWAIIFLGFAILATEFASAGKVRDFLVAVLKTLIDWGKKLWDGLRGKKKR